MEKQEKPNYLEIGTKIVTAVVALGGLIWGIVEFQKNQEFNETHELRKKLWDERFETYAKVQAVTGMIIVKKNDPKALDSLKNEFDLLYYSTMVTVEDSTVEDKMIEFANAFDDFRQGIKKDSFLKKKQIELMRAIANSQKKNQDLLTNED